MAKFIDLEGVDASGKSLQLKLITEYFEKQNKTVKHIHFPMYGHNMFSEMISRFLRGEYGDNDKVDPIFIANIYAMDRYMYKKELLKDLKENDVVVMDRYVLSNMAYQGAKTKNYDEKEHIMKGIIDFEFGFLELPYPDLILFFDVPITEIERRLNSDKEREDRNYLKGKQDIHEKDIDYQRKVRDMYLSIKDLTNFFIINTYNEQGILSPEDLFNSYINLIK